MEADEDAQEPNFPIMELDNAESGIQDANEAIIAVDDGETSAIIYSDLEETSSNPLQSTEDQIVVQSEMERDEPPSVSPQLTSGSTSEILDSPLSSDSHSEEGNIMIVIPQIQLQGDYHTYDVDPCVLEIIRETRSSNSPQYTVATRDGSDMMVTASELQELPGGLLALQEFNSRFSNQRKRSSSYDSDTITVSARSNPKRQARGRHFVDLIKIDLSGEDELNDSSRSRTPISRASKGRKPKQKRSLTSAPLRRMPSRNSRRSEYAQEFGSPSEEPESTSSEATLSTFKKKTKRAPFSKSRKRLGEDVDSGSDGFDSHSQHGKRKRETGEATRRSERTGRRLISMRERGEEDIPEQVAGGSGLGNIKYVGAKEHFKKQPKNSAFRLRHRQICDVCDIQGNDPEKGLLVFCEGCTLSYHQSCLGPRNGREHLVTKVGDHDFVLQCRRCIGSAIKKESTAPGQGLCQVCHEPGSSCKPFRERKTAREEQKERDENSGEDPVVEVSDELINEGKNVMFRCRSCYQAFHMHHLTSRSDGVMSMDDDGDQEQIAEKRFDEYSRDWMCHDCLAAPGEIDSLVAWRPIDLQSYNPTNSTEQVGEQTKEYLVKWKDTSYYRTTWKPGPWVWGKTTRAMRNAFARRDNGTHMPKMRTEDAIPEDYLRVDIVFEVKYTNVVNTRDEAVELARVKEVAEARVKFKGLGYEEVVWEEPPDPADVDRWNDFKRAYENWVRGRYVHLPVAHNLDLHLTKVRKHKFKPLKEQPKTLTGGKLMDYQLDGLNWLLYQWHRRQNAILADEMGLGKTIQVIGFLANLKQEHKCWPFLIVVPNSTCANWRREIQNWAPSLRVVTYFGSSEARRLAHQYELFPGKPKDLASHMVVTSYDAAEDVNVQGVFRRIPWAGLIVDEGQRLKNDQNLLYGALSALKAPFKILLTGTPLQNNQRELFNLLQFLDASVDAQALEDKYETLTKENVPELHTLLRPFFLRRTKAEVLTFLPPMAQVIVPVTMSALQKQLYRSILAKNQDLLKSIFAPNKKAPVKGLRNMLMQLRKCLCHPFVYSLAIEERTHNAIVSHRRLVEASSKLQLLAIMLPKLQERGHRVLIFSQFLDMITMMEDFLQGLSMEHERLDGTMGSLEKQKRIDAFNAPNSPLFALLLSTRAGGVGINLATAETVIILDPDFNPHQDIQAISRAHRIGQKNKVLVFQLMTRGSAEEKIMQIGKKKMALDHVLIEQMDANEADADDLESVLRFGAEALFKDSGNQSDIRYDSASIDKLLDRSQIENTKVGESSSAESQFSFARVWANESGTMEDDLGAISDENTQPLSSEVWEKILQERAQIAAQDNKLRAETLGRGKRRRQEVNYDVATNSPHKRVNLSESESDFQAREAESDGDETVDEAADIDVEERQVLEAPQLRSSAVTQGSPLPQVKHKSRVRIPTPPAASHPLSQCPPYTCLACNHFHPVGSCPLKLAGVEYCNLCGLAHFGNGRACPQLNSEFEISKMMRDIKSISGGPEPAEHVKQALRYLSGIKGDLVQRKKRQAAKVAAAATGLNGNGNVNGGTGVGGGGC